MPNELPENESIFQNKRKPIPIPDETAKPPEKDKNQNQWLFKMLLFAGMVLICYKIVSYYFAPRKLMREDQIVTSVDGKTRIEVEGILGFPSWVENRANMILYHYSDFPYRDNDGKANRIDFIVYFYASSNTVFHVGR